MDQDIAMIKKQGVSKASGVGLHLNHHTVCWHHQNPAPNTTTIITPTNENLK